MYLFDRYLNLRDTVVTSADKISEQTETFIFEQTLKDSIEENIVEFTSLSPFEGCDSKYNSCHSSPRVFRSLYSEHTCRCAVKKHIVCGCFCSCQQFLILSDKNSTSNTKVYQGFLWEGSCWTDLGDLKSQSAFVISGTCKDTYCVFCSFRGYFTKAHDFVICLKASFKECGNKLNFIGDISALNSWNFPQHQIAEISSFINKANQSI